MTCPRCAADPQPIGFDSPRECAFTPEGDFTPENWNCATIEALLELEHHNVEGFDESLQIVSARRDGAYGGWIVLTRYKHRGCTSSAIHVGDFWPATPLTYQRALIALGDIVQEENYEDS